MSTLMQPPGPPPHALPRIVSDFRSPNFHAGRGGHAIGLYVEHDSETDGTGNAPSLPWFCGTASGVSCHHLIARDGTRYDLVQRADTAYHAGDSAYQGWHGTYTFPDGVTVSLLNVVSIGTEFESSASVNGPGTSYTDEQLWTGAYTRACSLVSYAGLVCVRHAEIALPPGRRHDPSFFPWEVYLARVQAWLTFLRAVPAAELPRWCL